MPDRTGRPQAGDEVLLRDTNVAIVRDVAAEFRDAFGALYQVALARPSRREYAYVSVYDASGFWREIDPDFLPPLLPTQDTVLQRRARAAVNRGIARATVPRAWWRRAWDWVRRR